MCNAWSPGNSCYPLNKQDGKSNKRFLSICCLTSEAHDQLTTEDPWDVFNDICLHIFFQRKICMITIPRLLLQLTVFVLKSFSFSFFFVGNFFIFFGLVNYDSFSVMLTTGEHLLLIQVDLLDCICIILFFFFIQTTVWSVFKLLYK